MRLICIFLGLVSQSSRAETHFCFAVGAHARQLFVSEPFDDPATQANNAEGAYQARLPRPLELVKCPSQSRVQDGEDVRARVIATFET